MSVTPRESGDDAPWRGGDDTPDEAGEDPCDRSEEGSDDLSEEGSDSLPVRQRIIIDADACPVTRDALAIARRRGIPVIIAGNTTQNLRRHIRRDDPDDEEGSVNGFWVDTLAVGIGADSADFAIVEILTPRDIVVTQDIGLASMVLGRGARAIGVRGRVYDPLTIDMALQIRHEEKKLRRAGKRTSGPDAFSEEDRRRFQDNLLRLIASGR